MKKNLKKDCKIILVRMDSISSDQAIEIARRTGHLVIVVPDMDCIKTLEPKDRDTIIKWLKNAPRPIKHT